MKRNDFIKRSAALIGGGIALPYISTGNTADEIFSVKEISDFVVAAHSDLDETKRILEAYPLILNCTDQMIRGDFETAMGAASHMGRKDIADYLCERGARLDIFNLTFMGYTDLVKQLIKQFPNYLNAYGPHGYTLLHHSKMGGHDKFSEWLMKKGLEVDIFDNLYEW